MSQGVQTPRRDAPGAPLFRPLFPPAPPRPDRRFAILPLVAVILPLLLLAWPLTGRQVNTLDDLGKYHLPVRAFYARCLANGDEFLWWPQLHGGFYLHGEGQGGFFHPLHLLLYATLPLDIAINLECLLNYPILLLGTWLFLRRSSFRNDAALFGAAVFTFSGFNLLHFPHVNAIAIVAHIPWLLLAIRLVLRGETPWQVASGQLGVGLLTASQWLLGYPQYVWFSLIFEGLYVLWLLRPWPGVGRLTLLSTALGLGCLVGGVQLVPTWDALTHSVREAPTPEFLAMGSLRPANLVQLVGPYLLLSRVMSSETALTFYTHEYGLYGGSLVLLLALWAMLRVRHLGPRRGLALTAIVMGTIALLLAMGSYTPLFQVTSRLPLLGLFRCASRHILFVHAALALLAAIGYEDLARGGFTNSETGRPRLWPLFVVPALGLAVAVGVKAYGLARPHSLLGGVVANTGYVLAGPLLLAAATGLVVFAVRGRRWALPAMLLFAVADQALYGLTYVYHEGTHTVESFTASIPAAPAIAPHRLVTDRTRMTLQGQCLLRGYAGLPSRHQLDLHKEACLRVAGAAMHEKGDDWQPIPNPLSRARLVSRAVVCHHPAAGLDTIDPETIALVDHEVSLTEGPRGEAAMVSDQPGLIQVETDAPSRQLLVLTESYHEGWQARIDGRECQTVRVYGDLLGCVVEAGRHEVELRFQPRSQRIGAWVSVVGCSLLLLSVGFPLLAGAARRKPLIQRDLETHRKQ